VFWQAIHYDADNGTARFNLACAEARLGKGYAAVAALRELEPSAELRAKIEADADFDGVREDGVFREFVEGLPGA